MKRQILRGVVFLCTILALSSTLTACGNFDRALAGYTGKATKECIDGVQYLQFTSGASVAYDTDGLVKLCKG